MEIILEYMLPDVWPAPAGWTVVGRVGNRALAYDVARKPHLIGDGEPEALDVGQVNAALAPAVDAVASALWPGGWTHALPLAFGLNRRTCQPDRIAKNGLGPAILRALAMSGAFPDAEGMGWVLSALARYADEYGEHVGVAQDLDDAERAAANAIAVLRAVRREKPLRPVQED
ncbi:MULTISPECIES: hypothetical protein [unclassified Methylobacterium]|uniref:hypothetical protein n=1 Tax=unclassified Methylobacterium TaxID=2615210 RepID=UPI00226AD327|nr:MULTISPECIES: hypothetical protein [unclassified Methylobacterium]